MEKKAKIDLRFVFFRKFDHPLFDTIFDVNEIFNFPSKISNPEII